MTLELIGLPLVALFPFFGAGIVAYLAKAHRITSAWGAGFVAAICLVLLSHLSVNVFDGKTIIQSWVWIKSIGLTFSFRLDGLGMIFSYIIVGIGFLIIVYARYYLSAQDSMGRFYSYILLFMGSMVGIVLSENILQLVVFWELTSLSSFLLISFWQYKKEGRDGATIALVVTGAGGLTLMAGMLLLGHIAGSYELSVILNSRDIIINHHLFTPTIILILLGVMTKSAQFPFHFWLPHAMAAPTPVSAYLHSATMVKAGVFLLARLFPVLSATPQWNSIVISAGLATLLIGAFIAFFKDDLKALLAYSTVSHLGLVTFLFGLSSPLAAVGAIFHIMNHAAFKASSFMVAGIVDHEAGTRSLKKLGGLVKLMPHTATLAMVAAASMAGVPLFNGFLSKEMFLERSLIDGSYYTVLIPILATIAATFSVAYSFRFVKDTFFGPKSEELPKSPKEPPKLMRIPIDFLISICFLVGIIPTIVIGPTLFVSVLGILQTTPPEYSLKIWHGFNLPLLMSAIALIGGVLIYMKKEYVDIIYEKYFINLDARNPYNLMVEGMFNFAKKLHSFMHQGLLHPSIYALIFISLILGVCGFTYGEGALFGDREFLPIDAISVVVTMVLIIGVGSIILLHHQRLLALIIVGIVGLVVVLAFVKLSAPDLALTQLSVEMVTIVLMLSALYYLPAFTRRESSSFKLKADAIISILAGVGVAILALSVYTREYTTIAKYFIENSVSGGGGTNIVNVILVDFRGFDTLGEITVLGLAGIAIFAMLKDLKLYSRPVDPRGFPWTTEKHPPIMQIIMRALLPMMLLVAVYIFLRGHNLPGGGFIAGLVASVALIVQYLSNGLSWARERLTVDKHFLVGSGILIAGLTGVVSMIIGFPFLTSVFATLNLPIVGEFEIASAVAFDLGVFLVVVGATVMILVELSKLTLNSHKLDKDECCEEDIWSC
ncbi:MAG: monovalent cation/H+ antiporter subunit A [Sulfurospirillaceae bacterium]|jgi:multicomponent K+:H+ antiporter subunit A|nr:monovalent cation/H+ antiporter subunit A [Sulfurospirillaceae bacterium]MCK9546287.1 monovalent cation/H+ antiporter subunit A [Sulfurospirillaceae bacterium]MDY0237493.1 monovalent cation/H+ antiporter subunit A [Campylobacterales bacterium]